MSVLDELKHINVCTATFVAIVLFAFVAPGFLTVYYLSPRLFIQLDVVKLLVLSISITLPPFMFLFITTLIADRVLTEMNFLPAGRLGGFKDWSITHGVSNASIFFVVLVIAYLFELSPTAFLIWLLSLLAIYILIEFFRVLKLARMSNFNPKIRDPRGEN
jgi:hypothetical protein